MTKEELDVIISEAVKPLVEALEWFSNERLYKMNQYMTARRLNIADGTPGENILIQGNPILNMGLNKAKEALTAFRTKHSSSENGMENTSSTGKAWDKPRDDGDSI